MKNLDEMILDIHDSETVEIINCMDENARKRVETKVLNTIRDAQIHSDNTQAASREDFENVQPNSEKEARTGRRPRLSRRFAVALAATMVMTLGLTAVAARTNEWDILLLNYMGINNPDTLQLESGEVEINQSVTSPVIDYATAKVTPQTAVTLTAVSSIGDQNTAYIRLQTDYEMPADFNPETDYILPSKYIINTPSFTQYASTIQYFVEDNKLGFVLHIQDFKNLNRSTLSLHFGDLYWYHNLHQAEKAAEETLLCEGSWNLEWTFRYQSNTKTYHVSESFERDGCTYHLSRIEISPISVRMDATRSVADRHNPFDGKWLDAIIFTDGTVREVTEHSGSGLSNGVRAHSYVGPEFLGEPIVPDQVDKLVIGGVEISLK